MKRKNRFMIVGLIFILLSFFTPVSSESGVLRNSIIGFLGIIFIFSSLIKD
jgi:hypothetical protein